MKKVGLIVGAIAVALPIAGTTHSTHADTRSTHAYQHIDATLRTLYMPRAIPSSDGPHLVAPSKGCLIQDVSSPWVNVKTGEQIPAYTTAYLCDKAHDPTRAQVMAHVITHNGTLPGSRHAPSFTPGIRPHLTSLRAPTLREARSTPCGYNQTAYTEYDITAADTADMIFSGQDSAGNQYLNNAGTASFGSGVHIYGRSSPHSSTIHIVATFFYDTANSYIYDFYYCY